MNPALLHTGARVTIGREVFEVGKHQILPSGDDGGWYLHHKDWPLMVYETEYLCSIITAIRFAPDWTWPHAA